MTEPGIRIFESATLGVPPLKMVLVHARNDAQNAAMRAQSAPVESSLEDEAPVSKEQAIRRLIERLEEQD